MSHSKVFIVVCVVWTLHVAFALAGHGGGHTSGGHAPVSHVVPTHNTNTNTTTLGHPPTTNGTNSLTNGAINKIPAGGLNAFGSGTSSNNSLPSGAIGKLPPGGLKAIGSGATTNNGIPSGVIGKIPSGGTTVLGNGSGSPITGGHLPPGLSGTTPGGVLGSIPKAPPTTGGITTPVTWGGNPPRGGNGSTCGNGFGCGSNVNLGSWGLSGYGYCNNYPTTSVIVDNSYSGNGSFAPTIINSDSVPVASVDTVPAM